MNHPAETLVVSVKRGHTRLQHSSGAEEALPLKTKEAATLPPRKQSFMGTPERVVISVERGSTPCKECPYYEPSGVVEVFGGKRQAKCRQLMAPFYFDCHEFDVRTIAIASLSARPKKMKKLRKPYRKDHKTIHPVGWKPAQKKTQKNDELSNE